MLASSKHTTAFPVISLFVAAMLWGVFWYPLRLLEQFGLHGLWATLLIYCGTALVMLPLLWGRLEEISRSPWMLLMIALTSGWCNTAFILAILDGNVVRVLLLFYLSPLWATLFGWLFLKEQLGRQTLLVLFFAMTGAMIMLWDEQLGVPLPQGDADWLALSSGFAFAVTNTLVRKAQAISVRVKTVTAVLGVIIVAGILIITTGQAFGTPDSTAIFGALILGAIGLAIMTLSVQYGVTHMPVHRSAIILLFEIVAGAVSSLLLTDEVIQAREWIGGGLVIVAAYFSARTKIK